MGKEKKVLLLACIELAQISIVSSRGIFVNSDLMSKQAIISWTALSNLVISSEKEKESLTVNSLWVNSLWV